MGWPPATENHSWVLWPDRDDGPLEVKVTWHMLGGRWECVGLSIGFAPGVEERPLTTGDVRSLAMVELLRRAAENLQIDLLETYRDPHDEGPFGQMVDNLIAAADSPRRQGRPPLPPERLEEVARVYREAFKNHHPPRMAVAEHFTIGPSTAATWISKARAQGFLGPTTRGQAGGIDPPGPSAEPGIPTRPSRESGHDTSTDERSTS